MAEMSDRYDPASVESRWYGFWEERGYFHADAAAPGRPYAIVIPPRMSPARCTGGMRSTIPSRTF